MKKIIWWIVGIVVIVLIVLALTNKKPSETGSIKIGWISDLSGPQAKYGAFEAGTLAMEEINKNGGINGRPLKIIFEDGKCNGTAAVNAMQKLVNIDKVNVVLGGHCSPESLAIAPIAEKNHVIMLASITTSPGLTKAGDYIFRTSPISTVQSGILAKYMTEKLGLKNVGIIYEQTDYARPIAEGLKQSFETNGGQVIASEAYNPGSNDFRTIILKIKALKPDAVFVSPQSPDAGMNILKQINELGLNTKIFGNDVLANMINIQKEPNLFEGLILAQPDFDESANLLTKKFVDAYSIRFNTTAIPYGVWTAESYDAVYIISKAIEQEGDSADGIRDYLKNLKDYSGASGLINFDSNVDGIRNYALRLITGGKIIKLQ